MKRREFLTGALGAAVFNSGLFAGALKAGDVPKTLILGGGVFALGCALARPGETIVLERVLHLGEDFALTCAQCKLGTPTTPLGKELADALIKEGLVTDGILELPPLADFLSVFFAAHGGRAFMFAELADLNCVPGGWDATIYGGGSEGFSTHRIARFVDVTARGWRNRGAADVAGVSFGALTAGGYFTVDLPPDTDWRKARLELRAAWEKSGAKGEPLAEVNALKYSYKPGRIERTFDCGGGRYSWVPSGQFATLIEAFEEGLKWNAR